PTVSVAPIKHIETVRLGPSRVLVVLIPAAGQGEQKTATLSQLLDDDGVREIRDRITSEFAGKKLSHAAGEAAGAERPPTPAEAAGAEAVDPDEIGIDRIRAAVIDLVAATREERIIMAGTANLARSGHEF